MYKYTKKLITETMAGKKARRFPTTMKGICVHNTANNATAKNERAWLINNSNRNTWTGYHTVIDEKEVIQVLPYDQKAWACGDGSNGEGNNHYISIEITEREGAEDNAIAYIAELLLDMGWDTSKIKSHRDFSGKNCPRMILPHWDKFIKDVNNKMVELQKPTEPKIDPNRVFERKGMTFEANGYTCADVVPYKDGHYYIGAKQLRQLGFEVEFNQITQSIEIKSKY